VALTPTADRVLYTTGHGSVSCLDATDGRPMWTTDLGLSQTGRVWTEQGTAGVMALWDQGTLCGLDPESGRTLWAQDFPVTALSRGPSSTGPGVVLGDVLVGWGEGGRLTRWSPDGREILWAVDLSQALGLGGRRPRADELGPLCVCGGMLVTQAGAYGNRALVGVDLTTGSVRWNRALPRETTLTVADGPTADVPFVTGEGGLSEVDPSDGTLRWTLAVPLGERRVARVAAGYVAVAQEGDVTVVDRGAGRIAMQTPTRGLGEYTYEPPTTELVGEDGRALVYVVVKGTLAAYEVGK